jgi:hypothetical protein
MNIVHGSFFCPRAAGTLRQAGHLLSIGALRRAGKMKITFIKAKKPVYNKT